MDGWPQVQAHFIATDPGVSVDQCMVPVRREGTIVSTYCTTRRRETRHYCMTVAIYIERRHDCTAVARSSEDTLLYSSDKIYFVFCCLNLLVIVLKCSPFTL